MKTAVFLFDLDGVIFDTEGQYTEFWDGIGRDYLGDPELSGKLKGETIAKSLQRCFPDDPLRREEVRARLYDFEAQMKFEYVPGAYGFLEYLKGQGYPTAIVTSSNRDKMAQVYKSRPEIRDMVCRVLTGDDFARSKPYPDCYLLGAAGFRLPVDRCVVFEDSFNGLKAGRAAGMKVVGLSTTNAAEAIAPLCDVVIPDFRDFDVEKVKALLA